MPLCMHSVYVLVYIYVYVNIYLYVCVCITNVNRQGCLSELFMKTSNKWFCIYPIENNTAIQREEAELSELTYLHGRNPDRPQICSL